MVFSELTLSHILKYYLDHIYIDHLFKYLFAHIHIYRNNQKVKKRIKCIYSVMVHKPYNVIICILSLI